MVACGQFTQINADIRQRIARLNTDGVLDSSFSAAADAQVTCVALQADGKVLLGGKFDNVRSSGSATWTPRTYLARLNTDGTLDTGFNVGLNEQISGMAVQADAKIMLSGYFDTVQPQGAASPAPRQRMVRLNGDGTLDDSFTAEASYTVYSMGLRSDGTVLIGGPFPSVTLGGSTVTRQGFTDLPSTAATQTLTAAGSSSVSWLRGGSAPEVKDVGFEVSVDGGTSWSSLGAATRVAGGWQSSGLSLPGTGLLRAQGRTPGGFAAGSSLLRQVAPFGTALLTSEIAVQGNATTIESGDPSPSAADHTDFGAEALGGTPVVRTFTIQNTGAGALNLTGTPQVALTGLNTADFTVTEQPAATVAAGGSTTFKIAFSPFSTGLRTATVRIVNNDADENPCLFAIQGTALPSSNARLAGLTLTGATLTPAFTPSTQSYSATVPAGTSSLPFTATVEEAGATAGGDASPKSLTVGSNTLTIVVTAPNGSTTRTYTVTVIRQTTAESAVSTWAASRGVPASFRGLLDDPDGDGAANLLEFAFGTAPLNAGGGTLGYVGNTVVSGGPVVGSVTVDNVITRYALFVRRTDHAASGIAYTVSFSAGLMTWEAAAVAPTVLADDGTYQVVSVPFPATVDGSEARFFRVGVSALP